MSSKARRVNLPEQVIALIDPTGTNVSARVKEALVLELFLEGQVSSGKAAELLDISKSTFRGLLAERGLPYFQQTIDEVMADAEMARSARTASQR